MKNGKFNTYPTRVALDQAKAVTAARAASASPSAEGAAAWCPHIVRHSGSWVLSAAAQPCVANDWICCPICAAGRPDLREVVR